MVDPDLRLSDFVSSLLERVFLDDFAELGVLAWPRVWT